MEFRLLGPFEAWHEGAPVDLGDLQQRYVLTVLLLHANKPVTPERLIEIIWPEQKPRTNLVTGYIAKLRKTFRQIGARDVKIETTPTGYVLRVNEEQLDTARFDRLCTEAAAARQFGDSHRAGRLLREAVGLWRGRFLEDLDIDRIGGSEVIPPDDARVDAVTDLAELELEAGDYRSVRDRLRPVVRADPSLQRQAALLMRALLANGDRIGAMTVYQRSRETLDEYGMATSPELRWLAWLVQHGEQRSTLPPRPARFTGRAEELASIESAARSDDVRVMWLSGMPGVGKTALAIEAAHRLSHRCPDGLLFVALNGFTPNVEPTTPAEALAQLLLGLGVPAEQVPPTMSGRAALYRARLAGTKTLMVLDNAATEDQVRPLLPDTSGCLAIVTSRKVGDLEAGANIRIGPLPANDAVDLFRNLVGEERLRGRATQVTDVVHRCGRLPLQIKVVASQFRRHDRWPLEHLLRLLAETGPWSSAGGFDQAGIIACTVSYHQLDDAQRTLFRLLGLIPGQDLSRYGAAALAHCDPARARALLDDLHAVSLLEETVPERYHMLDPLKDFAVSVPHPATPHEGQEALERLLDFYLVTTASAIAVAFPFDRAQQPTVDRLCPVAPAFADQKAALAWLATERTNLVAAVRYAAGHERREHTWQLAVLLWRYFNTTGHLEDWIETLELAKRIVLADPANRYGQAHVLLRLALAHRRAGRLTHALELAAQALPRWVQLGDTRGEADTLCAIAKPTMELGDHDLAIAHFDAALAKYEEIGDAHGQANALSMLGHLNELRGNLVVAQAQHRAAVRLLRTVDHTQGLAHALDNLGCVQQRLGRLDEALVNHEEAYTLAVDMADSTAQAYALNNVGNVHRLRGRLDDAVRFQERARTVANGVADAHLRTQLSLDRGTTFRARGEHQAALRAYQAALDLATDAGDRTHLAHANHGIAQVMHAIGNHERAVDYWRAAHAEFHELHQPEANEIQRERDLFSCACAAV
ncbi:MAG TPA: tetratricopeptide repeat protein [Actinophytocola sp.]|uniref:AfsR/SARP family transcriptional regulator n=1 Tax=Actinophytocola sp. TaxID=1872138 RepID=UPI002DDD21FD|nr:tetratricopeptide repeat protein [Actinophytocola sp.]HEV2781171.1 tetratricopeptide repeat protein [Actinophytocola sp.]